jgi:putative spermidine/putrescine transport system ATP-binding protein
VTHDQGEALTMSDRMAVFNQGRIEQVGTPAEVYEKPLTPFVAGFVGTSNLIKGDAAQMIIGKSGTFTVRPEKIHLGQPNDESAADETSAVGTIAKVVYLGPETRYLVDLDAGPQLVVDQQNLRTSSSEALALEGMKVRLTWKRLHNLELGTEGDASGSATE